MPQHLIYQCLKSFLGPIVPITNLSKALMDKNVLNLVIFMSDKKTASIIKVIISAPKSSFVQLPLCTIHTGLFLTVPGKAESRVFPRALEVVGMHMGRQAWAEHRAAPKRAPGGPGQRGFQRFPGGDLWFFLLPEEWGDQKHCALDKLPAVVSAEGTGCSHASRISKNPPVSKLILWRSCNHRHRFNFTLP